jgi:hypothetical protein
MEMLPLPSAPYDIQPANVSAFKTFINLYNEKMKRLDISPATEAGGLKGTPSGVDTVQEFQGIDVVFSSSVGLHDITVVKLENTDHFVQWATGFAASQGVTGITIDERLNRSVAGHLNRSISYFVFDIVNVSGEKRTAEPLAYFFNTTFLYYPLNVTYDALPTSYWSRNHISVFLVADGVVREEDSYVPGVHFTGGVHEYIEFSPSELRRVFGSMGALFGRTAFAAHLSGYMHASPHSSAEVKDVVLSGPDFRRPSDAELRSQYERADYLRSIKPLSPSLAYYMLRSAYEPDYAPPAPFMALILLGIIMGPLVLGVMFRDIMERGDRRSAVWVAWLTLYCIGIAGVLSITSLTSYYSGSPFWFLPLYLVLFVPLVLVLYLGERFKSRPPAGRHVILGLGLGMSITQVLAFVFIPNSIIAVPMAILCFPALGILGIVLLPILFLTGRKHRLPAQ